MSSAAKSPGARHAGAYLRELLLTRYRSRWATADLAVRSRPGEINQAAAAQVLAAYLWDRPRRAQDRDIESASLKDLVSRALSGKVLSRQTLQLFIDAFDIDNADSASLWTQWESKEPARVIIGSLPPLVGVQTDVPPYQAVLIHDFHEIGADGLPARQRTVYGIRALQDGVTKHRYSFDTQHARVEGVYGGTPSEPYHLKDSAWAVDLTLPHALGRGEETSLEYITTFHYDHDVEPCFRRAIHQRIENVALRVAFHPDKLPKHIWRAEWHDYRPPNDRIAHQEEVELDGEHAVYWRLDVVERAVVGFVWKF